MPQIERHVIPVTRAESATYALPYWVVDSVRPGPTTRTGADPIP